MKFDFKGILEGAWNSLFVKKSIESVHNERMIICKECPYNSTTMKREKGYKTFRPDFHCSVCGCNLDMKTRCLSCECPVAKWTAYITEEEEQKLLKKLDDKQS